MKKLRRSIYLILGVLSLVLAGLGVLLPLLPTTPFVLASAYFFARSSEQFHQKLLQHRIFGQIIRDWERNKIIRRPIKYRATTMILLVTPTSLWLSRASDAFIIGVCCVVILVLVYLWSRPEE